MAKKTGPGPGEDDLRVGQKAKKAPKGWIVGVKNLSKKQKKNFDETYGPDKKSSARKKSMKGGKTKGGKKKMGGGGGSH